jgi:nitroreductase
MNDVLKTIGELRTIHGDFEGSKIPEGDIDAILDATLRTANASARQGYSIIVIDEEERMDSLFSYRGSHAFIFCVDYTRLKETAACLDCEFDGDNVNGFLAGATDAILAAQTSVIAAKSMGIDSLITNGMHRKNIDEAYEILKLPQQSCFPLISVVFGYPKEKSERKKGRLDKEYLVHRNEYRPLGRERLIRSIAEYDDKGKNIGLIDNWEELGFRHYLEWFFKRWSGKPGGEKKIGGKIKEMQERLVKSGFWFA